MMDVNSGNPQAGDNGMGASEHLDSGMVKCSEGSVNRDELQAIYGPTWDYREENVRRARLRDLRRLSQHRYGHVLPDDDAGREDLWERFLVISLAPLEPEKKMRNEAEICAPWLPEAQLQTLIQEVMLLPVSRRKVPRREIGKRMNLTFREREITKCWTVSPVDMTDEEMAEWRKDKDRARRAIKRAQAGKPTRDQYLAKNVISRTKPWEAEGISRATWYRRRETGCSAIRSTDTLVPAIIRTTDTPVSISEKRETSCSAMKEDTGTCEPVSRPEKRATNKVGETKIQLENPNPTETISNHNRELARTELCHEDPKIDLARELIMAGLDPFDKGHISDSDIAEAVGAELTSPGSGVSTAKELAFEKWQSTLKAWDEKSGK
jgi:hypothetical protein